jgi:hypothetical protein
MTLNELLTSLSHGNLSNLRVGGSGSGTIPDEHKAKVVGYVNQALLKLYTKFVLSEKELTLQTYDNIMGYPLRSIHADTDSNNTAQKYIRDTEWDKFEGAVVKVLAVFNEVGDEIPLNREDDPSSMFTPYIDTLQIPYARTGDVYFVQYQAKHLTLTADDLAQEVNVPSSLTEALSDYVAYAAISPMNGPEHSAKAFEYLQKFEMQCDQVLQKDLVNSSVVSTVTNKFEDRGFA